MCDLFSPAGGKTTSQGDGSPAKKWGPRLGPGAPRRRVPLSVSFSHRRVGSSILASLSEAGGNELQKMASKPLPPHSPPFTFRHVKRAYTPSNAIGRPSLNEPHVKLRPFLCMHCVCLLNGVPFQKRGHDPIRNGAKLNRELLQWT